MSLEQNPDAVIVTTPPGEITYWNPGAEAVFGFSSAEAIGQSLPSLLVPQNRQDEDTHVRDQTVRTGFAVASVPCPPVIRPAAMQNEIAGLPAIACVHALRANGFLFQLVGQAGFNIGRSKGGFRP